MKKSVLSSGIYQKLYKANASIMTIKKAVQNKISHLFLQGSDLAEREKEILDDASTRTGFIPKKLMDRSSWWTSKEIGAFRYIGEYKGKKAVLKIQGVKPNTSEIYMINAFRKANKSKVLRPPNLYAFLPWDKEKRYEALIMEFVEGKLIVNSPTNEKEIDEFFRLYTEYRKNCCLRPWLDKPEMSLSEEVKINFKKWRKASRRLYPTHSLRRKEDSQLIDQAVDLLIKGYKDIDPEFQHGHFSASDLYRVSDSEVVILSNLYWSWKSPFYDAIFGQHWFIYHLANLNNISEDVVEIQRSLWFSKINSLAATLEDKRLLNLALLERAAAGLNLDALSIDPKNPIVRYLVETTRKRVRELIGTLS